MCGRADACTAPAARGRRHALEPSRRPRSPGPLLELKLRRALTDKPMFAFRKDPVAISMVEYIT